MQPQTSHTILIDRARKFIDVRLSGYFNPEDASWVGEETFGAVRSLGPDVGHHVSLFDLTDVGALPPATVSHLKTTLRSSSARSMAARKMAFVSPHAMQRLQVLQLREARPDIGVFEMRETALEWLFS